VLMNTVNPIGKYLGRSGGSYYIYTHHDFFADEFYPYTDVYLAGVHCIVFSHCSKQRQLVFGLIQERPGKQFTLLGGKVEDGESLALALNRECYEEIGAVPLSDCRMGETNFNKAFEEALTEYPGPHVMDRIMNNNRIRHRTVRVTPPRWGEFLCSYSTTTDRKRQHLFWLAWCRKQIPLPRDIARIIAREIRCEVYAYYTTVGVMNFGRPYKYGPLPELQSAYCDFRHKVHFSDTVRRRKETVVYLTAHEIVGGIRAGKIASWVSRVIHHFLRNLDFESYQALCPTVSTKYANPALWADIVPNKILILTIQEFNFTDRAFVAYDQLSGSDSLVPALGE